jgi:hypothetical protein
MFGALASHCSRSDLMKFVVNQRDGPVSSLAIALPHSIEQFGEDDPILLRAKFIPARHFRPV